MSATPLSPEFARELVSMLTQVGDRLEGIEERLGEMLREAKEDEEEREELDQRLLELEKHADRLEATLEEMNSEIRELVAATGGA
jgi:uncharacterized coiled-coil DUF342 family protein